MNKAEFRAILVERDQSISQTITELEEERAAIRLLLSKDDVQTSLPISTNGQSQTTPDDQELPGPARLFRQIFKQAPSKSFKAPRLRDELQRAINDGRAVSESKNLLSATHTTLRSLLRQGFVRNSRSGGYKLKTDEGASTVV